MLGVPSWQSLAWRVDVPQWWECHSLGGHCRATMRPSGPRQLGRQPPKFNGVNARSTTRRLGSGISGERVLGEWVVIGLRWPRMSLGAQMSSLQSVSGSFVCRSITLREMYEPGIGARRQRDNKVLGFILALINPFFPFPLWLYSLCFITL